ncbi:MAG: hypothetical protein HC828_14640 [Blastochloris sp.]|nr:hypothetical protein [Blastochloris sp.]
MNEQTARQEHHSWEDLSPEEVLAKLVYELYNPVSMLGTQFDRLISEEELLTEDEYDANLRADANGNPPA